MISYILLRKWKLTVVKTHQADICKLWLTMLTDPTKLTCYSVSHSFTSVTVTVQVQYSIMYVRSFVSYSFSLIIISPFLLSTSWVDASTSIPTISEGPWFKPRLLSPGTSAAKMPVLSWLTETWIRLDPTVQCSSQSIKTHLLTHSLTHSLTQSIILQIVCTTMVNTYLNVRNP